MQFKKMKPPAICLLIAALWLAGCNGPAAPPTAEPDTSDLRFDVQIRSEEEQIVICLVVANEGPAAFPGDENFDGVMALRNELDVLRASMTVNQLPEVAPQTHDCRAYWRSRLAPGDYSLIWGAPGYGHTAVTFTIAAENGRLTVGQQFHEPFPDVDPPTRPPFGQHQPLVDQAVADLAAYLGLDQEAVTPRELLATEFPDASLGVPEPDQMVAQVITPGFIIWLRAEGELYRYHAAGDRVVRVPEQVEPSQLPVTLYFGNIEFNPEMLDCSLVYPVERLAPIGENPAADVLNLLFAGPTPAEAAEGFVSIFSTETAAILLDVNLTADTAYVNLVDIRPLLPEVSASCGREAFMAEVETTLRQAVPVQRVLFALEGDPALFYEWIQMGCTEENDFCDPTPFGN
jgi:hypothetical protein